MEPGKTLYGTTYFGGTNAIGTVFAVNTDGTGFTTLHGFTKGTGSQDNLINSDGANPSGGLLLSGNTLYGTAYYGGTNANGTVFALNTDGTGFATLHNFTAHPPYPAPYTNSDGVNPSADLVLSGNTLYGTCYRGGTGDAGTVFALNTDGTGFAVLHSFPAYSPAPDYTNSDGGGLFSGLVLSGDTLYGATYSGGSSGNGTVFALNTNGTGFTNLHSFAANSDGAKPLGTLLLSGNTLYGTASAGGSSGQGTVFAVNTDGTGFTNLHSFTARAPDDRTNTDGAQPNGGLILSGNTLYGTAYVGGSFGLGTVFALNTDGSGFTTLQSFTGGGDGSCPSAGLLLSGNTLYGTAYWDGTYGYGTVFSIFIQPQLTMMPSGPYVILTWPTNYAGFSFAGYTLQSTTNLVSTNWNTISPAPVVVKGQNTVSNSMSGTWQFYRLATVMASSRNVASRAGGSGKSDLQSPDKGAESH
jgi:uncharacterized repeat protein (TIGR03803 family)